MSVVGHGTFSPKQMLTHLLIKKQLLLQIGLDLVTSMYPNYIFLCTSSFHKSNPMFKYGFFS